MNGRSTPERIAAPAAVRSGGVPAPSRSDGAVSSWFGLPYAALPDGASPFDPAVPCALPAAGAPERTDVPIFPQLPSRLEALMGPAAAEHPQSSDAFRLDVHAPVVAPDPHGAPVLVFVHGGAWATGGGPLRWYDGGRLAREDVVVVNVNYRLGPAGHLASPETDAAYEDVGGHRPLHDLLLALRWVREHIAVFGGDPARVTVAGQSAGAWYAGLLAMLPAATGLLRRAALWSLPEITPWTPAHRAAFTADVNAAAGGRPLARGAEAIHLEAGARVLAAAARTPGAMPPMYLPCLDGELARAAVDPAVAAELLHVDALQLDDTAHEMTPFLPPTARTAALGERLRTRALDASARDGLPLPAVAGPLDASPPERALLRDASWLAFGRVADRLAAAAGRRLPIDRGRFTVESPLPGIGAGHCVDLPFRFGDADAWHDAPMLAGVDADAFEQVAAAQRNRLVSFVGAGG